mmetsp:Transcript_25153/g.58491  ORF Transcript_25153/g.58491 Transcript_25153/m.58491 type:complete len:87 (-) Transcript_25153:1471-1731(-)
MYVVYEVSLSTFLAASPTSPHPVRCPRQNSRLCFSTLGDQNGATLAEDTATRFKWLKSNCLRKRALQNYERIPSGNIAQQQQKQRG